MATDKSKASKSILKSSPLYENILRMRTETPEAREKRLKEVCSRCIYFTAGSKHHYLKSSCDYLLITGRARPCAAMDCVKEGVFRPLKTMRRKSPMPYKKMWERIGE